MNTLSWLVSWDDTTLQYPGCQGSLPATSILILTVSGKAIS